MNNDLLIFLKKHTDTLIEQRKPKAQETLEIKLNKQTETFSFNPAINIFLKKNGCLQRLLLKQRTLFPL